MLHCLVPTRKNPTEAVVRELLNLALQASPSGFSHVASADLVLAIQVFEAENVGPDANGVIYAAVPTGLGRWHRFPPMLMFLLLDAINVGSFRIDPTSPTQEPRCRHSLAHSRDKSTPRQVFCTGPCRDLDVQLAGTGARRGVFVVLSGSSRPVGRGKTRELSGFRPPVGGHTSEHRRKMRTAAPFWRRGATCSSTQIARQCHRWTAPMPELACARL